MSSPNAKTLIRHMDLREATALEEAPLGGEEAAVGQDTLVGRRVGEYVVRRCLGSGGMGIVYEGEHVAIGRKVAMKFIRAEHAGSPRARDLLREAQAASAIRHHGIIEIFGIGQLPGVGQYLVMEYLEGQPLSEVIHERAPMPPVQVLRLLAEVLEALAATHAVGVIHRDLKPGNIFLVSESSGSEYVKVLDFGLAKRSSTPQGTAPPTQASVILGTPDYMAPEQVLSEPVGPYTDLYAVGGIAFEMLTGQRPFQGRSPMETMVLQLQRPPPAPSSLVPLPAEVDTLILRLLAKEPWQRPSSAVAMAEEMRELAARLESCPMPPAAAPASEVAPSAASATPKPRTSRRRLKLAVGGLLVAAMGLTVSLAPYPREQSPGGEPPDPSPRAAVAPLLTPLLHPPQPQHELGLLRLVPLQDWLSPEEPRSVQAANGTLRLVVRPFVYVVVDGQMIGRKPPQSHFSLPAGVHLLELHNRYFKPYVREIVISPGETLEHTALLEPW
jgi:serine/threonine protein kinase